MSSLPLLTVLPIIFTTIVYWISGLNANAGDFFATVAIVVFASWAGQASGLFLGAAFKDVKHAFVGGIIVNLAQMLVGGFFLPNVPTWIAWLRYLSIFKYTFSAISLVQIQPDTFNCDVPTTIAQCSGGANTVSGADVLSNYDVLQPLGFDIGMIFALMIFYRILGFLALKYLNRPKGTV